MRTDADEENKRELKKGGLPFILFLKELLEIVFFYFYSPAARVQLRSIRAGLRRLRRPLRNSCIAYNRKKKRIETDNKKSKSFHPLAILSSSSFFLFSLSSMLYTRSNKSSIDANQVWRPSSATAAPASHLAASSIETIVPDSRRESLQERTGGRLLILLAVRLSVPIDGLPGTQIQIKKIFCCFRLQLVCRQMITALNDCGRVFLHPFVHILFNCTLSFPSNCPSNLKQDFVQTI